MATWTYFTSYLDGSRPVTKAERDELYTQLSAKLTSCPGGYSLYSAFQTALINSNLSADRAYLVWSGGSLNGRIHDVLEAASSAWSNYSSIVTSALSAEGISASERSNILSSNVEDHRLWNYYRRVIDGIYCACQWFGDVVTNADDGPGTDVFTWDVSAYFGLLHTLSVSFVVSWPPIDPQGARAELFADGVRIWDSGCVTTSASTSVGVPAGTAEIRLVVTRGCFDDFYEATWQCTLTCA